MCICYRKVTKEVNQKCNHCETKSKVSIIMEKTHDEIWDAIIAEIRFQIARDENQSSIAKKLGVSRVAVHRWLKGDRGSARKTIDDLKAYMNALACTAGRPSTAPAHKPILTYVYALMKFAVWLQLFGLSAKPS